MWLRVTIPLSFERLFEAFGLQVVSATSWGAQRSD